MTLTINTTYNSFVENNILTITKHTKETFKEVLDIDTKHIIVETQTTTDYIITESIEEVIKKMEKPDTNKETSEDDIHLKDIKRKYNKKQSRI